jgi:hypothetical protein
LSSSRLGRLTRAPALALALGLAALSCAGGPAASKGAVSFAMPKLSPVLVLGVAKDFEQAGWEDARIGFGLGAYLAEALYSSGDFTLAEGRPEVGSKLRELQSRAWAEGGSLGAEAERLAPELATRYIAYGRVVAAGAPQSSASIGVLHARSRRTLIDVEVSIYDSYEKRTLSAPGRGSADRASGSAVFDLRGKEVALDRSTIGTATQDAIRAAVKALTTRLIFTESKSL